MNKEQLFAAMDGIDETLIQRSEDAKPKKSALWKWCALAACFGIVLFAGIFFFGRTEEPDSTQPEEVVYFDRRWEPVWNDLGELEEGPIPYYGGPEGSYWEELTPEQMRAVLPEKRDAWETEDGGGARFLATGEAYIVSMHLTTQAGDIYVGFGERAGDRAPASELKDAVKSQCGDVEYTIYRYIKKGITKLEAQTRINDVPILFSMYPDNMETEMAAFEAVLECFSWYGEGCPALDRIRPSRIPEYRHEKMSYEDALEDPDFGSWILKDLPKDFSPVDIYRDIDYYRDELSCSFRDESGRFQRCVPRFRWCASRFTENEEDRLVSVSEKEIYDISLYPPPRADTVPREIEMLVRNPIFRIEELTLEAVRLRYDEGEIDGNPYNDMVFGVLYGDILVEVSTVNMEPEWLYEQLMKLPRS